jgi:Tol biopolymer transport system component
LRDIGDARIALEEPEPAVEPAPALAAAPARSKWRLCAALAGGLVLGAAAMGVAWKRSGRGEASPMAMRFVIPVPEGTAWSLYTAATQWVPSPDGRYLAMVLAQNGTSNIWLRPIGATAAHRLDKTDGASFPFWSPDSLSIGFFADGVTLRRVSVASGAVTKICDITGLNNRGGGNGATWNQDGVIVYGYQGPLMRVAAVGGVPVPAISLAEGDRSHHWPQFLPDGRHILYLSSGTSEKMNGIYVQELGSKTRVQVMRGTMRAMWSPPGYLLFTREGNLFAQRMNAATYQLEGEPLSVAEDVMSNESNGRSTFAVSQNGVLLYRAGGLGGQRQLSWRDRTGKVLREVGKPAMFSSASLSPDEKSVALVAGEGGRNDAWIMDATTGVVTPMTHDANVMPGSTIAWSPDSAKIAIGDDGGLEEITVASGRKEPLAKSIDTPEAWLPDGKSILGRDRAGLQLFLCSVETHNAQVVATTRYGQIQSKISPDGKYIAYVSLESGLGEIYVASFPTFAAKRKVSESGGGYPAWSKDGKLVYYRAADGTMTEVEVRTGADITLGEPKKLFKFGTGQRGNRFGVSADGRFLISEDMVVHGPERLELNLVVNWEAELKK